MIMLVTGGAASGKSAYAEEVLLSAPGPHVYIATLRVYGDEERQRIARHKQLRAGKGFQVIECSENVAALTLPQELCGGTVLLECLGDLVANEMYEPETFAVRANRVVEQHVLEGIAALEKQCTALIVVTNEVGADGCTYSPETENYQHLLGRLNCLIAAKASKVVECCAGQPYCIKEM